MNAETFCEQFATFAEAPNGVAKLRELILQLAVQGKLVPQDTNDEPADAVIARITDRKSKMLDGGEIQRDKKFAPILKQEPPWPIPQSWAWVRLQDIFEISRGGSPRPAGDPQYFGGPIPWITVGEITKDDDLFLTQTSTGLTELGSQRSRFVEPDDLLITNSGATLGVPKIAQIRGCINDGVALLKCFHSEVVKEYAYLFLRQQTPAFRNVNQGMGQPNLNTPILAGWYFAFPPLAEQRRIVGKVDQLLGLCDELAARQAARREARSALVGATLDRLVSARSAAEFPAHAHRLRDHFDRLFDTPTTLPQLRQAILQLAVQGQLVPQDPNDESAQTLVGRIEKRKSELIRQSLIPKQSALPPVQDDKLPFRIPIGWRWIRLESVCEIITKGSSPTWQGVQYVGADDGVLFVTSENVGNYVLRKMDEPKYVERKFNEMEPRSILQRDDLLVNLVGGSIGRSAIFDRDDVANINQAVGIIRLVRGDIAIDRWYLLHYLNSPCSLQIMFAEQVETARANLSLTNMKHFLVPLPPLSEQKRIVSKVTELLSLCDALEAKLTQAESASTQLLSAAVHHLLSDSTANGKAASCPM